MNFGKFFTLMQLEVWELLGTLGKKEKKLLKMRDQRASVVAVIAVREYSSPQPSPRRGSNGTLDGLKPRGS